MATNTEEPTSTIRAVVWEGKVNQISVRSVPKPTILLPGDAIVRVTSAGLCGSDLHTYRGFIGALQPPWSMGHEAVGIVVEVGPATEQFKVGDRVVVPGGHDTGHLAVEPPQSAIPTEFGNAYGQGYPDLGGCQAEYLRVPFADDSLISIPQDGTGEEASDLDWLMLTDVLPTAWSGLDNTGFQSGDSVAVFGLGPIGLACVYIAAVLRGASQVFAVDHVRQRLDKAASLGPNVIPIDFSDLKLGKASEQILRRRPGGVHRAVDCVGQEGSLDETLRRSQNYVLQEAIRVVTFGGGVGLTGVYTGGIIPQSEGAPRADEMEADLSIDVPALWAKSVSMKGGVVPLYEPGLLPRLYELIHLGKAKGFGRWLISTVSTNGVEDAPGLYDRFDKRQEIKVVFRFPNVEVPVKGLEEEEDRTVIPETVSHARPNKIPGLPLPSANRKA